MTEEPTAIEVNCETNEKIVRPLTADEIQAREESLRQMEEMIAAQEAKNVAKQSAITKLAALGLTEEEAAAIIN